MKCMLLYPCVLHTYLHKWLLYNYGFQNLFFYSYVNKYISFSVSIYNVLLYRFLHFLNNPFSAHLNLANSITMFSLDNRMPNTFFFSMNLRLKTHFNFQDTIFLHIIHSCDFLSINQRTYMLHKTLNIFLHLTTYQGIYFSSLIPSQNLDTIKTKFKFFH